MSSCEMPDWERGIGVAEAHASGPVRVIPVTPQMQEADRRRQQQTVQSDAAREWRASVFAGREEPARVEKAPCLAHLQKGGLVNQRQQRLKPCIGKCGRNTEHDSGKCHACRKYDKESSS